MVRFSVERARYSTVRAAPCRAAIFLLFILPVRVPQRHLLERIFVRAFWCGCDRDTRGKRRGDGERHDRSVTEDLRGVFFANFDVCLFCSMAAHRSIGAVGW